MTAAECVIAVAAALDRLGIPFMIVGSFSSNVYGIARSTKDADFVIQLGDQTIGSGGGNNDRSGNSEPSR